MSLQPHQEVFIRGKRETQSPVAFGKYLLLVTVLLGASWLFFSTHAFDRVYPNWVFNLATFTLGVIVWIEFVWGLLLCLMLVGVIQFKEKATDPGNTRDVLRKNHVELMKALGKRGTLASTCRLLYWPNHIAPAVAMIAGGWFWFAAIYAISVIWNKIAWLGIRGQIFAYVETLTPEIINFMESEDARTVHPAAMSTQQQADVLTRDVYQRATQRAGTTQPRPPEPAPEPAPEPPRQYGRNIRIRRDDD